MQCRRAAGPLIPLLLVVHGCFTDLGPEVSATGGVTGASSGSEGTTSWPTTGAATGSSTDALPGTSTGATTGATTGTTDAVTGTTDAVTGTTTGTGTGTTTTGADSTSTTEPGTGSTTCGEPECEDDMMFECDPWLENCPAGQKCMPWADDGGNTWNAHKCSPVAPNPGQTGDPCTVDGSGTSGVDSCDIHHMCWDVDPNTEKGVCIKFCQGSPMAPSCDVPSTVCNILNSGILILCLPVCHPLEQDCPDDDLCLYNPNKPEEFFCVLDASGSEGQENDPCEYANACDPGLFCAGPSVADECDQNAAGCCTKFCDLDAPQCTNSGAECLPWYSQGQAPPGFEDVGYCGLPN